MTEEHEQDFLPTMAFGDRLRSWCAKHNSTAAAATFVEHIAANSCFREKAEDRVEKSSRPNPRIRNYEHPVAAKRTHTFRERTHHTKTKVNVRRDGEEIKTLICAPLVHG